MCRSPWGVEVGEACGLHVAPEARCHGVRTEGISDLVAEDEALIRVGGPSGKLLLGLTSAVGAEGSDRSRVDRDRPPTALGLRLLDHEQPVRRECLTSALESRFETWGVWGATTLLERRRALSARGEGDAPDVYGDEANTEDITRMQTRLRRAREVAEEFEQDLRARLRRWKRKAAKFERDFKGKCSDCGGQMEWRESHSTCTGCGLQRWPSGKVKRADAVKDSSAADRNQRPTRRAPMRKLRLCLLELGHDLRLIVSEVAAQDGLEPHCLIH
jgi:hypothetical protein